MIRYHLGAEELIELGSDGSNVMLKNRRPFLAGRIVMKLGVDDNESLLDMLASAGKFLADKLALALNTLAKIVNVPLGALAQGVDGVIVTVSDLLKKVPALGDLLAEILLLGGALVKFGLSIPSMALQGLGNLLAGLGQVLKADGDSQQKLDKAQSDILAQAPDELKDRIVKILAAVGISGDSLTPDVSPNGQPVASPAGTSLSGTPPPPASEGSGLRRALAVGVPVVGVVALVTSLAMK